MSRRAARAVVALAAAATITYLAYGVYTLYAGTQKFLDIIATALETL